MLVEVLGGVGGPAGAGRLHVEHGLAPLLPQQLLQTVYKDIWVGHLEPLPLRRKRTRGLFFAFRSPNENIM